MPRHKYGTKPKNFPGRRNTRRIAALHRMELQLAHGLKRKGRGPAEALTPADRHRIDREADALALRIRPEAELLAIRTKKDRGGTGRLHRPA